MVPRGRPSWGTSTSHALVGFIHQHSPFCSPVLGALPLSVWWSLDGPSWSPVRVSSTTLAPTLPPCPLRPYIVGAGVVRSWVGALVVARPGGSSTSHALVGLVVSRWTLVVARPCFFH